MLSPMATELDEATQSRLHGFAEQGNSLAARGDYQAAIQLYNLG
jgi:hypothetical protein